MKRSRIRSKSITPEAKLKEKLMGLAKKFIKLRDGNTCWTCGKERLFGNDYHGGHFIPDGGNGVILRYHEDNIHPQCRRCNFFLSGNQAEYYIVMVQKYGQEFVDELFRIKHQDKTKWYKQDYLDKIAYYEDKIKNYGKGKKDKAA